MQANQNSVIWTVVIATIVMIALGIFAYTAIPTNDEIKSAATDAANKAIVSIDIPTASEIAGLITVPVVPTAAEIAAEIDTPESFLSLREHLKNDAIQICDNEFDFNEIEDLYSDDDEISLIREYIDERDYSGINLGIDNSDDKQITVSRVYKVEVEPDIGDNYKDKVYVICSVTSDDGELEADLTYSL